ncbi:uncharacterized protein BDV14DRAFT_6403 [Aspergillus stella-maris]|uniref:uncharacterized protein n=1 Tax=Aspergillus stella-maris TaxID=1810926 RepID=UPI003CCDF4FF
MSTGTVPEGVKHARTTEVVEDIGAFLSDRAAERGKDRDVVGDVRFVAVLVRLLGFGRRENLDELFERAYTGLKESNATPELHGRVYGTLPSTLSTYLMGEMVRSRQAKEAMQRELRKHNKSDLLRYKIKVLRDSFIWLGEMMGRRSDWVDSLIPQTHALVAIDTTRRVRWLTEPRTKAFWEQATGAKPLTQSEIADLESLWALFDGNDWIPIRAAFCLARLDYDSHRSDSWSKLSFVVWPLCLGA